MKFADIIKTEKEIIADGNSIENNIIVGMEFKYDRGKHMKIRERYLETSGETVKVYEYDADDEEPDCMKCIHLCDSQDICDECGSMWLNYLRREAEEIEGEN